MAIKILEKERIVEVADVERVSREIHILKLIRHKHVIQLYEVLIAVLMIDHRDPEAHFLGDGVCGWWGTLRLHRLESEVRITTIRG